jgi:competence protein ComEA
VKRNDVLWVLLPALVVGGIGGFTLFSALDDWRAPEIVISDPRPGAIIAVSVQGAVATPGVYSLPGDSRVIDLIDAAGGTTSQAIVDELNLAARLRDEQQISVPSRDNAAPDLDTSLEALEDASGRIDINTATARELETLPGIGPALAQAIVENRNEGGPFTSVDDLARVKGISTRMVEELRDSIVVTP